MEQRLSADETPGGATPEQGGSGPLLTNPPGVTRDRQGADVTAINALNRRHESLVEDPEVATRIAQYEMAFAMQASVPGLMDLSGEDAKTMELYGCQPGDGSFASNCLLARRLAERGVRFIQLYHKDWDHHGGVKDGVALKAQEIDRACMALITDLKQRGLFDETLIVWAGEFGRTPMSQGGSGRDHHNKAMSVWLAGAGVKGGIVHGATDELGYAAVDQVTTVHDLHATMLDRLGIQHEAFSFKFQGLDARLTGVEGAKVIRDYFVNPNGRTPATMKVGNRRHNRSEQICLRNTRNRRKIRSPRFQSISMRGLSSRSESPGFRWFRVFVGPFLLFQLHSRHR